MHPESTLVLLFAAATAVALVVRRLRIPYTVGLVLAGLALGAAHLPHGIHLTKAILYAVFLPGLLFEAAYHLDFAEFRKSARAIFGLAMPGVMATIGATASLLVASSHATGFAAGFGWPHALIFSALIAATDPIAVVALFKSLGAPKRLSVLTEGESLVNDGTAIVLFTIIYATVTSGEGLRVGGAAIEFLKVVGLGFVAGGGLAFLTSQIIKGVDDPMIEITLTTVTAYGAFVVAENFHSSGVIATVTAGMVCGSYAAPRGMKASTRIALESFWEYVAFALNSLVFLLIGLEVRVGALVAAWLPIAIAFAAVTVGRAAIVFAVSALLRRTTERISWQWSVMLTWGGLRGALSMVLAVALPHEFPQRDLIVTMTFGAVLLSIVVQGTTAGPLLRALKLAGNSETMSEASRAWES
jgi:CPA1 family monovalent cation:H+ antiporter